MEERQNSGARRRNIGNHSKLAPRIPLTLLALQASWFSSVSQLTVQKDFYSTCYYFNKGLWLNWPWSSKMERNRQRSRHPKMISRHQFSLGVNTYAVAFPRNKAGSCTCFIIMTDDSFCQKENKHKVCWRSHTIWNLRKKTNFYLFVAISAPSLARHCNNKLTINSTKSITRTTDTQDHNNIHHFISGLEALVSSPLQSIGNHHLKILLKLAKTNKW